MRKYLPVGLVIMVLVASCFTNKTCMGAEPSGSPNPVKVIASLFPQYDFARRIGGQYADVRLLLPSGAESHSYEPTPSDMKRIADADLFVYTGEYMEPWAGRAVAAAAGPDATLVVDASNGIELRPGGGAEYENGEHEDDEHHEHAHAHAPEEHNHVLDPHIWLDPVLASVMVDNIANALIELDSAHAIHYRDNAAALKNELSKLHADFKVVVENAPRRNLVFGERFAFAYFFARYGLKEIGPYNSCAPGTEPGLKAVIDTVNYIKANDIKYIYSESRSANRISKVIVEETGTESLIVDSLHNPTPKQLADGYDYVGTMRRNMDAFAKGLQ